MEDLFDADDLYRVVRRLNGGGFLPVGETDYDNIAAGRQHEIQELTRRLIEDILLVTEVRGSEASVARAREKALTWFGEIIETFEDTFNIKMVRQKARTNDKTRVH